MLKFLNQENCILIILASIFTNYLLFLSPTLLFIVKLNFVIFFIFSILYFLYFEKNKLLILFILSLIVISLGTPTIDWDARSIWMFKSKQIFFDQSILSVKDNYAEFSNASYPNIAPAFSAGLATLLGYWNEIFPKAGFTFMLIPPLIIFSKFFNNNMFLICLSLILFTIGKFLVNGEMDGLLSLYFVSSALFIYNLNKLNLKFDYNFFTLIFFFLILSLLKIEGVILLFILAIVSLLKFIQNKKLCKKIIISFFIAIIPVISWNLFCIYFGIGNTDENYNFNLNNFFDRALHVQNYFLIFKYLILNDKFLTSLLIFLISILYIKDRDIFAYVGLISLIYILLLFIIYLSTPLELEWHLNSANRVIKPIALFLSIFTLHNIYNRFFKI